jgi:NADPH-dependent 2,4-dienoyl-CoA reductase/sulfur reductase-like enzyme/rhodanese-related sulfurtransferase
MDVVVVGGSAAGLKAACRIARLQPDARIRVLVKDEYFGYSLCGLPYYLSGDVASLEMLAMTPNGTLKDQAYFRDVKGIEVLTRHEVFLLDRAARYIRCHILDSDRETTFPYDKLVIATGAKPLLPAIPGLETPGVTFFTRPAEALKLREDLERGRVGKVAILGGGFIGLELCEAFHALWGVEVDLVEFQPNVLPGLLDVEFARLVEAELARHDIGMNLGCGCSEIIGEDDKLCLFSNAGDMIKADRIVVATGVRPNVDLARRGGLVIGVTGGVKVDGHLRTSDHDVYAAGDCVELPSAVDGVVGFWSLGSLASRMGRVVGDNVCNGDSRFGPVVGATTLKVFGLNVGAVGLTAGECRDRGYEIECSWGTFYDRLHYYPGSEPIHLKLVADQGSGRVLGLQALSRGNILHIIDVAAQAIRAGAMVDELQDLEHAYAPPYAQPINPIHSLSHIIENSRSAGIKLVSPIGLDPLPRETLILDVRNPDEIAKFPLEIGERLVIAIPLEQLRSRLPELPHDLPVLAICQMGGRAWDAALMLRRAGWQDVSILAGGILFQPHREDVTRVQQE